MKNVTLSLISVYAIALLFFPHGLIFGQEGPPRETVTEESMVSFARTTPLNIALKALNELSTRLERIVIIDPAQRTDYINVTVENKKWREALLLISKAGNMDSIEHNNYIQLVVRQTPLQTQQVFPEQDQESGSLKPVTKDLREITIEATFIEVDRQELREIGINWSVISDRGRTTIAAGQNVVGERSPDDVGTFELTRTSGSTDLNALFKALESENAGEILANPKITVIDGRTGRVQIGQDFSIKQRDFSGNIIDIFVSSGIILSVTPRIIVSDTLQFIHLTTQVERSSVSPSSISTIINKTIAETELLINDGEEVGIGGLYLTQDDVTHTGIPYLKDIPKWFFGLGYLFGYEKISTSEKELVILLKADIVPTLEERLIAMEQEQMNK